MSKATAPSIFRDLQHLYKILLYVLVVAMLLSFLLVQFNILEPMVGVATDRMLQVVAVLYCFAAVFVGLQLFRRKLERIRVDSQTPREKLNQYKSASLLQWSLMESAAIFSILCYLLTGNWAFLALAFTLLVLFGGLNPFKHKVMIQLRLSEQDVAGL
jgi:archaellum biogenesis protein FlaJ (TadC family)